LRALESRSQWRAYNQEESLDKESPE
jgi:hypothetical protein